MRLLLFFTAVVLTAVMLAGCGSTASSGGGAGVSSASSDTGNAAGEGAGSAASGSVSSAAAQGDVSGGGMDGGETDNGGTDGGGADGAALQKDASPGLTLAVYLCGSNLESEAGAASADIAEMKSHLPDDGSLRVLILPAGSKTWKLGIDPSTSNIYELTSRGLELLDAGAAASMGDPSSLTRLLDCAYSRYPSGRHALVIWNHGAGPAEGVCFDEQFDEDGASDCLTMAELEAALSASVFGGSGAAGSGVPSTASFKPSAGAASADASGVSSDAAAASVPGSSFSASSAGSVQDSDPGPRLAWIGFDACLMASYETALAISPYADYMIASQEPESAEGWNYRFLETAASDASPVVTAEHLLEDYERDYGKSLSNRTLSCIDLSRVGAVSEALSALADEALSTEGATAKPTASTAQVSGTASSTAAAQLQLTSSAAQASGTASSAQVPGSDPAAAAADAQTSPSGAGSISIMNYPAYAKARSEARSIATQVPYEYDLVDLGSFLEMLEAGGADPQACERLRESIAAAVVRNFANTPGHCGLSLYFPFRNKNRFASPWDSRIGAIGLPDAYSRFLHGFTDVWMGKALADWNSPAGTRSEDEGNAFSLKLNEDQAGQLAEARLVVVKESDPGEFTFVYESEPLTPDAWGTLRCTYNQEALYFLDASGAALTGSVFFKTQREEGTRSVAARLCRDAAKAEYLEYYDKMVYLIFRMNADGVFELTDIYEELDSGSDAELYVSSPVRLEDWQYIEMGSYGRKPLITAAFRDWPQGDVFTGDRILVSEIGSVQMLPLQDSAQRYAFFELTDLQNNTVSSEPVPIPNPLRHPVLSREKLLTDNAAGRLSVLSAVLVSGYDASLQIDYEAENRTDGEIYLSLDDFMFDGTAAEEVYFGSGITLGPGETGQARIVIPAESLQKAGVEMLEKLSFSILCRDGEYRVLFEESGVLPLHVNTQALF